MVLIYYQCYKKTCYIIVNIIGIKNKNKIEYTLSKIKYHTSKNNYGEDTQVTNIDVIIKSYIEKVFSNYFKMHTLCFKKRNFKFFSGNLYKLYTFLCTYSHRETNVHLKCKLLPPAFDQVVLYWVANVPNRILYSAET